MPGIIDPTKEKPVGLTKRIIIPKISELSETINDASEKEVESWDRMASGETYYKLKDEYIREQDWSKEDKSFMAKCYFKPVSVCPRWGVGDTVPIHIFNVGVFTHKERIPEGKGKFRWDYHQHVVDITPDNTGGRPNFMTLVCREFMEIFVAAPE